MSSPQVHNTCRYLLLDYQPACQLLAAIQQMGWPVLLDSGYPSLHAGRFSIATANPARQLRLSGTAQINQLEQLRLQPGAPRPPDIQHLPFVSGWIGYWSYDAGRLFEQLPVQAEDDLSLPWIRMGYYTWALISDHQLQQTWLAGHYTDALATQLLQQLATASLPTGCLQITQGFQSNLTPVDYRQRFDQIQASLRAGDCYQVNLAQRFSASYEGHALQAWQQLRTQVAAPFSAYLDDGETQILSLSPERFLQLDASGQLETRPIKGTRPRGQDVQEDEALRQTLANSTKDRAENLMIVDLLRNDLGKVCQPGSIKVPELFQTESFSNVHHLVSRITGQLASGMQGIDLLKAAFPGGSITGAPKLQAMKLIEQLEPCRRSVYCGAIGYLDDSGALDFNIAIRTFIAHQGRLHIWGGGGLVADSQADTEYQETFDKVGQLIRCLQPDFSDHTPAACQPR